jgi:peptide deformylase
MPTLLKIATIGEPILRETAREVPVENLRSEDFQIFIDDLIATMRDANGAGLAAPQVHQSWRVCVLEVADNPRYPYKPKIPLTVLVNPILTPVSPRTFMNYEGCLSVPDLRGQVRRHAEIRIDALDRFGDPVGYDVRGITAGTFQHEVDHLHGKLFIDRVEDTESLCTWTAFTRYHEAEFRGRVASIVHEFGS